jgi:hypothetical protein
VGEDGLELLELKKACPHIPFFQEGDIRRVHQLFVFNGEIEDPAQDRQLAIDFAVRDFRDRPVARRNSDDAPIAPEIAVRRRSRHATRLPFDDIRLNLRLADFGEAPSSEIWLEMFANAPRDVVDGGLLVHLVVADDVGRSFIEA